MKEGKTMEVRQMAVRRLTSLTRKAFSLVLVVFLVVLMVLAGTSCSTGGAKSTKGNPTGATANPKTATSGFPGAPGYPKEAVSGQWEVAGGLWLLEITQGVDRDYVLWSKTAGAGGSGAGTGAGTGAGAGAVASTGALKAIVSFVENAHFFKVEDGRLLFTAIGGDDTGHFRFPYRLTYDLQTGTLQKSPLYLPLAQSESFGKAGGWAQALARVNVGVDTVGFDFNPRAGEVMAGGHTLPATTTSCDEKTKTMTFTFKNVILPLSMKDGQVFTLRATTNPTVSTTGAPGAQGKVREVRVAASGGDLKATVTLNGATEYTAETISLGGEGYSSTIRCEAAFR